MENSFKNLVTGAKSILVMLPSDPSFEVVAAGTALYLALGQEQGKEINIYSPTQMVVEFNHLVGVNKVKTELGNKNLAISFKNYDPQGIEKVSWDIDNGEFKLTIVPKVNVFPPNEDQVVVNYSGVAADLVVMMGGSDENSFQAVKTEDLANAKLAHIGTSPLSISGKTISSFATPGSSVSEVTANIIKSAGYKIEADMATNLLIGIEEGSDKLVSPLVTADTFALIAELMRDGGKRTAQGQVTAGDFPTGAIPGMPNSVPSSWTEPKIFKGTSVS